MKPVAWNILSIFVLLATCALLGVYASVYANPSSDLNPFPPPTQVPTLLLPSATATLRSMPPTWTVTPRSGEQQPQQSGLEPSSTSLPTATGFVLPSLTPTATFTNTPTSTPTVTNTPKPTLTPTKTPKPKPTKTKAPTAEPTEAPPPEPTEVVETPVT